jgi:hypothetical protein
MFFLHIQLTEMLTLLCQQQCVEMTVKTYVISTGSLAQYQAYLPCVSAVRAYTDSLQGDKAHVCVPMQFQALLQHVLPCCFTERNKITNCVV